jgi:hypothetical protein
MSDTPKVLNARQKAFNEHFEWWKEANGDYIANCPASSTLALAAAASAWNAACAWAVKRIGE